MSRAVWVLLLLLPACKGLGDVLTFADPFQGGAVIQRDVTTLLWGTAPSWAGTSVQITVDGQYVANGNITSGAWRAELPAQNASFKSKVTVSAAGGTEPAVSSIEVKFGDVVLCGGQSNSKWLLTVPTKTHILTAPASGSNGWHWTIQIRQGLATLWLPCR
jgi:hypothetical protein